METTNENMSAEEVALNEQIAAKEEEVSQGLPSDTATEDDRKSHLDSIEFSDEFKEQYMKDDKIFGRFDDIEAMAKSYKKLQDEKSANGNAAKESEAEAEAQSNRASVANEQLSSIAENGFEITDENFEAFESVGMTKAEAELSVLKMEKAANKAYEMVGGKEQYNQLMEWAGENLSESQIKAFAAETVGDNFNIKASGEFAIRGLQSMMNQSSGNESTSANTTRISGNTPQAKAMGYTSKAEYNSDMDYLRKNPNDRSAQRAYDSKMKYTNFSNLR